MNNAFTALTRPRMASGVCNCTSEKRMTTLTTSAAPTTARAASDSSRWVDTAKTIVATPYIASAPNKSGPSTRRRRRRARTTDIASAPIAGAARKRPSVQGPDCRISRAKIGNSAVAPPSSTAKRSSDSVPSSTGLRQTNTSPPTRDRNVGGAGVGRVRSTRMSLISRAAISRLAAAVA